MKKWSDLPEILEKDGKEVISLESTGGIGLLESIAESLHCEYDIQITTDQLIEKIAQEILLNPDYTRYMKVPITQEEVNYRLLSFKKGDSYALLMSQVYIPAISSALDLHLRIIQNVGGYFTILNTFPLHSTQVKIMEVKKTVTLILSNGVYKPVVSKCVDGPLVQSAQPAEPEGNSTDVPLVQSAQPAEPEGNSTDVPLVQSAQPAEPEGNSTDFPLEGRNKRKQNSSEEVNETQPGKKKREEEEIEVIEVIVISSEEEEEAIPLDNNDQGSLLKEAENLQANLIKQEKDQVLPNLPDINYKGYDGSYDGCGCKKIVFPIEQYKGMVPEVVSEIPYEVDGLKYYMVDVPEDDIFFTKYRDGRYFELHTSRRKGFHGVRRLGRCRGNFECTNQECAYFLENGKSNKHQFTTIGKNKFCYTCNSICFRESCKALKLVEFHPNLRVLEVYHYGTHSCQVKPKTAENDSFIEENLQKFGVAVGPKKLAQLKMTEEMRNQIETGHLDMNKIIEIGARLTDKTRIQQIKRRMENEMKSEKHSISAVAELKSITDTSDKCLIYKMHDENMTGEGKSYVFKSSRKMCNIMRSMDQKNPVKSLLQQEPAYFDGMHKRCKGWKTLTLWVYHPSPRRLMRLATMEVKGETTESVALFWTILNNMLQEVFADKSIYFNPYLFITDEAGANYNGIMQVYGQEGYNKSRTCVFHFKQSLQKMLLKFPDDLGEQKAEFEDLMLQLLYIATISEFMEIKGRLLQISSLVPGLDSPLQWWLARRYNLFPLFRGYCISSVNMAEIGHSTLKRPKPLALVDAAWEDVCSMVMQEQEHTKFLEGRSYSFGKGPSQGQIALKEKKQQRKRSREYQQAFKENMMNATDSDSFFIPNKKARHTQPSGRVFNLQGSGLQQPNVGAVHEQGVQEQAFQEQAVQQQAVQQQAVQQQGVQQQGGAVQNRQTLGEPAQPLLTLLAGFNIRSCYGCKGKFGAQNRDKPMDLILKLKVKRDRLIKGKWVPGWRYSWGYFHLDLNCVKLHFPTVEIEDIYLPNDMREQLTPEHVQLLEKKGWWTKIRRRYWYVNQMVN